MTTESPPHRIALIARGDPGSDGGAALRMRATIAGLAARGTLDVYVLSYDPPPPSSAERMGRDLLWIPMEHRRLLPHDYLLSIWGVRPRRLSAARPAKQRRVVAERLQGDYDVYWAYTDRAFVSLPRKCRRSAVITDLVDFEDVRDVALAGFRPTRIKRLLARADARALGHQLRSIARRSHASVLASPNDIRRLGSSRVTLVRNSYPRVASPQPASGCPCPPTYVFVGVMGYAPNLDGARWMVRRVWPIVRSEQPDASLRIIGTGVPAGEFAGVDGVEAVGWVQDIGAELANASASVVPLRIGSGTRLKVLEAWAHRVPVVSTTVGADGLSATDGVHLLIADDPESFAAAMVRVSTDLELRRHLVDNAERFWDEQYSEVAAAESIKALVETTLAARSHHR